jgi:hypothetical protein
MPAFKNAMFRTFGLKTQRSKHGNVWFGIGMAVG